MSASDSATPDYRALFFRIFPAIGLAMFGAALDQTIVASALPAIARSLGEVERISWVVVAYLVAATVAAPVYGRLGDAFGQRRMLLVALGAYGIGALLCALAPSLDLLAAARLVQGCGGGGLLSLSVAIVATVLPPRERGRVQGSIASIFAAAAALGPVAGGLLAEFFGWRAVFLPQLPLAMLAGMFALRLLPATPPAARAFSFDWLGLGLFALFVAPTILALDQARRLATGPLLLAAALLLFAAVVLVLLWRWQRRAPDPLLPLAVLTEPTVWRANLIAALVAGAYVGCIAFLPIYFVAVRGASALGAGIALLPLAVTSAIGATMAGRLLVRTGRGMLWPAIGLGFAAALLGVLALSVGGLSAIPLGVLLGLVALGFGTSFPMVQLTVQAAVPRERLGTATASVQFIRSLGAATGTALLGAVLFGALVAAGGGAAELFVALVNRGPEALAALDPAARAAFQSSLIAAFRAVFLTAAALVATAAWVCTRVPLQRF